MTPREGTAHSCELSYIGRLPRYVRSLDVGSVSHYRRVFHIGYISHVGRTSQFGCLSHVGRLPNVDRLSKHGRSSHFCRLSVVGWWSHSGPLSNVGRLSHACRLSRAVHRLVSPRPVVQSSSHVRCSFIDIACLRVSVLVYTSMPCLGTNRKLSLHLPTHALSHRTSSH